MPDTMTKTPAEVKHLKPKTCLSCGGTKLRYLGTIDDPRITEEMGETHVWECLQCGEAIGNSEQDNQ